MSHHHHHHESRRNGGNVSNRHRDERSPPNVDGGLFSIGIPQFSSRFLNEDWPINTNNPVMSNRTMIEMTKLRRGEVVGNGEYQTVQRAMSTAKDWPDIIAKSPQTSHAVELIISAPQNDIDIEAIPISLVVPIIAKNIMKNSQTANNSATRTP